MAIIVEHDKRKHEILQKSLDVFIDEGYEDATFQKIADRCGITRTTLYIYFKNKYEIFHESIKELLSELEKSLTKIIQEKASSEQTLRKVLLSIVDQCEKNPKLFSVLLNYLMQLKKSGVDTNKRVRSRIIRIRHLLSTIIITGMKNNEFRQVNIKATDEMLFSLLEATIFRIAVLNQTDMTDIRKAVDSAVSFIVL
ncbi:MAG: TetR/AcrR family transcriptional regulator [Spirochaetales bacterium]|nr:TetR/AcrR family transcriptional regulator [Spirochaetales bacterium]